MCLTDECDESRREFITAATTAVVGLAATNIAGQAQSKYPHNFDVVTRVLDDPTIPDGEYAFAENGSSGVPLLSCALWLIGHLAVLGPTGPRSRHRRASRLRR